MTQENRKYGWRPDLPDFRDFQAEPLLLGAAPIATPPPAARIPDDMLSVVFDQGSIGSCTGNMAVGLYFNAAKRGQYFLTDAYESRLFVYYNARLLEGTTRYDAGATIRDAVKALAKYGAPDEKAWPYNVKQVTKKPTQTAYAQGLRHQALTYASVNQNETSIKSMIAAGYPVGFGFSVYTAFESDQVENTGLVSLPKSGEKLLGGHAVYIIGYDSNNAFPWEIRNSWGKNWGMQGNFRMVHSYVLDRKLASDFWVVTSGEG